MTALLQVEQLRVGTATRPVAAVGAFELPAGRLGAVVGAAGSGRSSLLLALTGRYRGVAGHGRLGDDDLVTAPARVRRRTAVARIADLVELEPRLSVEESITERALTEGVPTATADRRVRALSDDLDLDLPRRLLVEQLSRLDRSIFALLLTGVRPADLVVLDDADHDLAPTDQRRLYAAAAHYASTGPAVLISTTDPDPLPPDTVVVPVSRPES